MLICKKKIKLAIQRVSKTIFQPLAVKSYAQIVQLRGQTILAWSRVSKYYKETRENIFVELPVEGEE